MKIDERTIADLLGRNKIIFKVPLYQRSYAWKQPNFVRLFEDIQKIMEGDGKRHFMGTLVFKPESRSRYFEIIDGQQRLATFIIILTVLRELSNKYATDKTKIIEKHLTLKGIPRFKSSDDDHEAFFCLLENLKGLQKVRDKHVKLGYEFFYGCFQSYIDNSKGQRRSNFSRFMKTILHKMIFAEIVLSGDDDVHSIFESINSKGMPLTKAELAKNFILSREKNGEEQKRLNKNYWMPMQEKIKESISSNSVKDSKEFPKILEDFLRAFLVAESGKYVSTTDLFSALRSYFSTGHLEDKLIKLFKEAEKYCRFINPEREGRKKLRSQLQRLVDLKMTTYYPVLLVLYRALEKNDITAKDLERSMQYIESFVLRRAFNSKVSRDLNQVFARIASQLIKRKGKNLALILKNEKWPVDDHFRTCFVSSPIYTTAPKTARFALESIERSLNPAYKETLIDKSIQVEHVFPQEAKIYDWDSHDLSGLKKNLHVMGNLTLTGYNAKLGNHSFREKKKIYKKSPYRLTKIIAKYDTWTNAEIEKRGERLLRVAMKIWPGPPKSKK